MFSQMYAYTEVRYLEDAQSWIQFDESIVFFFWSSDKLRENLPKKNDILLVIPGSHLTNV